MEHEAVHTEDEAAEKGEAAAPQHAAPQQQGTRPAQDYRPPIQKSPVIAALLAAMPGLGHVYNGLYQRGIILFLLFVGAIFLTANAEPFFGFAIAFVWLFNLLDSYRQATLINLGYATDVGLNEKPKRWRPGQLALVSGIVLFAIGALEMLDELDLFDWDLLERHWYVLFLGFGAWLIFSALRERSRLRSEEASWGDT